MLNVPALASAVILKAFEDAFATPDYKWHKQQNRANRWKKEAREFLTTANEDLRFWCVAGGLNMQAIIEQTLLRVKETEDGSK